MDEKEKASAYNQQVADMLEALAVKIRNEKSDIATLILCTENLETGAYDSLVSGQGEKVQYARAVLNVTLDGKIQFATK